MGDHYISDMAAYAFGLTDYLVEKGVIDEVPPGEDER
jgi:hypothetical protein